jgi:[CysO sulfur-carrier protein]-S-L-cysteine hydrolase
MSDFDIAISTIDTLVLPRALRDELMVHLLACAPNEGVGMLGVHRPTRQERGVEAVAELFVPGRNEEESPTHFTMAPLDVISAFRRFRERDLQLGAILHSHLQGPATPSVSDVNEWNYPEALMMIASFSTLPPSLRAWRVVEDKGLAVVQHVPIRLAPLSLENDSLSGEE